jgi:peroxiredoxin
VRQLAAFSDLKAEFDAMGTSILAASADPLNKASETQDGIEFPIAYGVTQEQADSVGGWWEDRRKIIQPSEFIIGSNGSVVSATYSTGPVGRLMPEDALKLIGFIESQKDKN